LLTPETLRRTFISIPMLMNRIQSDLHGLKWFGKHGLKWRRRLQEER
jgi:hypothetical protein